MIHRIILTGMRGSGKSHFAIEMAKYLGWNSIDLDKEIEKKSGRTISQIVQKEGWEVFRKMETEECETLLSFDRTIVATGGGVLFTPQNIPILQQNSLIVFLNVGIGELKNRLKNDTNRPPLLADTNPEEEINRLWEERKETYFRLANFIFHVQKYEDDSSLDIQKNAKALSEEIQEQFLRHEKFF